MMLAVKYGLAPKRGLGQFNLCLGQLVPALKLDIPVFLQSWLLR